jgi:hypothetical protein
VHTSAIQLCTARSTAPFVIMRTARCPRVGTTRRRQPGEVRVERFGLQAAHGDGHHGLAVLRERHRRRRRTDAAGRQFPDAVDPVQRAILRIECFRLGGALLRRRVDPANPRPVRLGPVRPVLDVRADRHAQREAGAARAAATRYPATKAARATRTVAVCSASTCSPPRETTTRPARTPTPTPVTTAAAWQASWSASR